MKVVICGGRDYKMTAHDRAVLDRLADELPISRVVSGAASGADLGGELWARSRGIPIKQFPANWKMYGKRAGALRNLEMADYADGVIAFPGGRGTTMMIKMAEARGLRVERVG